MVDNYNMKRKAILITGMLVLFAFAACTPISKQALNQVNTTASFQNIRSNTDKYLGKTVLWGGVVVHTRVLKNGTYIKVLQTELDYEHRPKDTEKSGGRFLVYEGGFLDPAVYKHGTKITVIGKVIGTENLPLGEIRYLYPVVQAGYIYIWKPIPRDYYPYYLPPYPYGWWW